MSALLFSITNINIGEFNENRVITHKKLPPMECYHIFSISRGVYLAKNRHENYSPKMVPTNPSGSWTNWSFAVFLVCTVGDSNCAIVKTIVIVFLVLV